MKKETYARTVKFKDEEKNVFSVTCTIDEGRFSMTAEHGGGCGQCYDHIKPKNEEQKELIKLWKTYHLNDMNAGTPEQEKFLADNKEELNAIMKAEKLDHYTAVCRLLKFRNLYIVEHPETKEPYKYGHSWLTVALPSDIVEEVERVFDEIEEIETEEKGETLVSDSLEDEEVISEYDDPIMALALHLELSVDELEEIEDIGNYQFTYGGTYYYVGEYDDLANVAKGYLTNDPELWKQAVEAGNTTDSLEEWAEEVVCIDGVGGTLNHWDGGAEDQEYNGINYTICRQ